MRCLREVVTLATRLARPLIENTAIVAHLHVPEGQSSCPGLSASWSSGPGVLSRPVRVMVSVAGAPVRDWLFHRLQDQKSCHGLPASSLAATWFARCLYVFLS